VYCGEGHVVDEAGQIYRVPRALSLASNPVPVASTVAAVDPARCRGCGLCEEHCPYAAPRVGLRAGAAAEPVFVAAVDPGACRGCGICVALCPTGALRQGHYTDASLASAVDRLFAPSPEGAS
jgi:heterodisulfide reductase subunit A